ncbi:hypothetical protein [uncultured Sphingomonas sp.]|uniref:hypothetical protein n=1 Tax=uncultured Sphingomonas sp. TaxID=158754 RepID=UPI0035C98F49
MITGRPLRFLVMVVAGWIGVRVMLLWPEGERASVVPQAAAATGKRERPAPMPAALARAEPALRSSFMPLVIASPRPPRTERAREPALMPDRSTNAAMIEQALMAATSSQAVEGSLPTPIGLPDRGIGSRWSASVFAIARRSGIGGGLGSSQLGGSQAGARLAYALDAERRFAMVGRVATPLEGRGREAALGVEWRSPGAPVRVFVERRFALDHGRGGPSLGVIAGVDRALGHGFRIEAYGQAGAIKRDRLQAFADGAARVTWRIAAIGSATLDAGAGAWGGAQPSAERLDVGPTLGIAAPIAERTLRLTVDWRERVAGNARPGSGPALSLGTDF